jgi:tRNA(His) 5'-end guanylyltransferase
MTEKPTETLAELSCRMKAAELYSEVRVPDHRPFSVRIDGVGFSSLTKKHFRKPRDIVFEDAMMSLTRDVMLRFSAKSALVQSDEISFFFGGETDIYNRRAEKITTVIAGFASGQLTDTFKMPVCLDARIVCHDDTRHASDYCTLRLHDGWRNFQSDFEHWLKQKPSLTDNFAEIALWHSFESEGTDPRSGQKIPCVRREIFPVRVYRPSDFADISHLYSHSELATT